MPRIDYDNKFILFTVIQTSKFMQKHADCSCVASSGLENSIIQKLKCVKCTCAKFIAIKQKYTEKLLVSELLILLTNH